MPKVQGWEREFAPDPEDEALLRHVMEDDDDRPPQGLHQGGFAYCTRHGDYYSGNERCPMCKIEDEIDAVDDYFYPFDEEF